MKGDRIGNEKNHYEEAIVLATKWQIVLVLLVRYVFQMIPST